MLGKSAFTQIIGTNIKSIRNKQGLSQEELADLCGFYRTYINLVETARRTPSSFSLYRIAKALKVDVDKIYPTTV